MFRRIKRALRIGASIAATRAPKCACCPGRVRIRAQTVEPARRRCRGTGKAHRSPSAACGRVRLARTVETSPGARHKPRPPPTHHTPAPKVVTKHVELQTQPHTDNRPSGKSAEHGRFRPGPCGTYQPHTCHLLCDRSRALSSSTMRSRAPREAIPLMEQVSTYSAKRRVVHPFVSENAAAMAACASRSEA